MENNLYDILGVNNNASEEVKAAYRDQARKNHPDKPGGSTEKMQFFEDIVNDAISGKGFRFTF